ncbi:GNAT family N-acetyltransferase [Candidatus Leptofilum sp.]|uniref:GNAT family N-acetyltransferase n=1 Tax=Candidatus Leptofilum sp. TaxID=3241576 RepID=UPI003B5AF77D
MIHQLEPNDFVKAADVLSGLAEWNVYVTAVLQQTSPGRIYVDNPEQPSSVFAISIDCAYLAGNPHNDNFNAGVTQVLEATLFAGDRVNPADPELCICVDSPAWEPTLADILSHWRWPPIWGANNHYTFAQPRLNWRDKLPAGYVITQLNTALLAMQGNQLPPTIADSIRIGWQNRENFLQNGFGFVALHNDEIVCTCLANVTVGEKCEIGIETVPTHRRLGLATAVTAATVDYCQQAGFTHIGWHCGQDNPGSIGTAVNVGFVLERPYNFYSFYYDEPRHYAELGRIYFFDAQLYEEAVDMLEIAIETDEAPPAYVYFLAARALAHLEEPVALDYLQEAVAAGFKDWELLQTLPEFAAYRDNPDFPKQVS